jgi:hypothetical protein
VDELAPVVNGGVHLQKIFGVMHDTCHAANKVASLMVELREVKANRQFHGDDTWETMAPSAKACFDFLCGNHTRNLPIDWFNRLSNKWLVTEIDEAVKTAKTASGSALRLECSREAFLRSLCKLTHHGHAQYDKGDGDAFADYLAEHYPHLTNKCVGRADFAKRQDWSLECAFDVFPLLDALISYTIRTLAGEANILRDTCLIQVECLHFEAYIHVTAVLWRQVFKELRGLTNSKGIELNPLELNHFYECLYDFGILLQSDRCFDVFNNNFRAWPHIYKSGGRSKRFYDKIERHINEDLTTLRSYSNREDTTNYCAVMKQVLGKFGEGIHGSLTFTLKKYLRQTNGELQNANRGEWETKAAQKMLCHNNNAERPFAVARVFNKQYPAITLYNLSHLSHSLVNGTHRPEHIFGRTSVNDRVNMKPPGIALTAHPVLRLAVNKLCSVRTRKIGAITSMVRVAHKANVIAKNEMRKRKAQEDFEENVRLKAVRAEKRDKADYTALTDLVTDVPQLVVQLEARHRNKKARIAFLHEQYHARVSCGNSRQYPGLGDCSLTSSFPNCSPNPTLLQTAVSLFRRPIPQQIRKITPNA